MNRFLTESASDVYDRLNIDTTNDPFNAEAPKPVINFLFGIAFSIVGVIYFMSRVKSIKSTIEGQGATFEGKIMWRAMISAYLDANDSGYIIIKMAAQSFIFLGGIQLNYALAFGLMLVIFALESTLDVIRILLALSEVDSLGDLVVTGTNLRTKLRQASAELKPKSVYEDTTRSPSIVGMVFVTQCLLISFVVADIFDSERHSCLEGSVVCPVGGTLGSWIFYVIGIFMQCVFLVGPKTAFGQSEINPAYWLQLLLAAKNSGAQVSWYDPVADETKTRDLKPSDPRIWLRFFMSFLINGVGFHILVHALPIQVAAQNGLLGVVFRAVGMLYLVDLDDTPGYIVTIVEGSKEDDGKKLEATETQDQSPISSENGSPFSDEQLSNEAAKIIAEARAKLDALASGRHPAASPGGKVSMAGALALGAAAAAEKDDGGDEEEGGDGADGDE